MNPWEYIDLDIYEKHMSLNTVFQLQKLNKMMKMQFEKNTAKSVMILGIAAGNGLENIDRRKFEKIYGVDVNAEYLEVCNKRYKKLHGVLETICLDIVKKATELPHSEYIIADLIIEYIGYQNFQKVVNQVAPQYVSTIIQINESDTFVSESPYLHEFDCLESIHNQITEEELTCAMKNIGYAKTMVTVEELPNGKELVRIDFEKE